MLIALVGIDLAGKSTQVKHLHAYYQEIGLPVSVVRLAEKPTVETVTQLSLRLEPDHKSFPFGLPPDYFAIAYNVDFLNHFYRRILPLLSDRRLVISDRYVACYKAYAHAVEAMFPFNHTFLDILPPADKTIYLRISVEEAFKRMASRATPRAIDETPTILSRLYESYERLAAEYGFYIVDGERPEAEVTRDLTSIIGNPHG